MPLIVIVACCCRQVVSGVWQLALQSLLRWFTMTLCDCSCCPDKTIMLIYEEPFEIYWDIALVAPPCSSFLVDSRLHFPKPPWGTACPSFHGPFWGGAGNFEGNHVTLRDPVVGGMKKQQKTMEKSMGHFLRLPKFTLQQKRCKQFRFSWFFHDPDESVSPAASQTSIHIGRWPKPWPFPLRGRSHVLRAQLCGGYATTYAYRRWWNETCICTRYETREHISSKFLALRIPGSSNGRVNELV